MKTAPGELFQTIQTSQSSTMKYQVYFSGGVIDPLERMQERDFYVEQPAPPELWEIRPFGWRTSPVYSKLVGSRDDAQEVMNKLRELNNN